MERLMQYVWQHKLWIPSEMKTVDGQRISVIDPGLLNTDAGPDFFNAKIMIGDRLWAGNVEIHVRASDWLRHGHDSDRAYDTVVLHVVAKDDIRIPRPSGGEIPQLVMPCARDFRERYDAMVNNPSDALACGAEIASLPQIYLTDWFTALAYERVQQKAAHIAAMQKQYGWNWLESVYVVFARALGFGVNSEPFERLAVSTPLYTMLKHRDSLVSVEAVLFGQAGFLDGLPEDVVSDPYVARLIQDYDFYKAKFGLRKPVGLGWKMSRMRPQNFPHRRIATLASAVADGFTVGSSIFGVESREEAEALFRMNLTGYWARRYNFGSAPERGVRALSESSVSVLVINVVVPLLYAYGCANGDESMMQRAFDILRDIEPERNSVVGRFKTAGIECGDAMTSQALIQLRRNYCDSRKCMYCRIGHRLLALKVRP